MVDMQDALWGDKIMGSNATTLTEHGPGALTPKALPSPQQMLPSQRAKHWLTHLPYDPACELCVQCKRPNSHHRATKGDERTIPLLVGDYCFFKSSSDSSSVTGLVMKVYPYKLVFGCVVQTKGPDPLVVARLAQFIKDTGLVHFAYRSDKEPAIVAMIQAACARSGVRGIKLDSENKVTEDEAPVEGDLEFLDEMAGEFYTEAPDDKPVSESSHTAVPEHSHPGESPSNGKAERTVQSVEDQFRTLMAAF